MLALELEVLAAPPPGAATQLNQLSQAMNQLDAAGALPAQPTPAPGAAPNLNDPNQLLAAMLQPTPGGTIIHYKVE